MNKFLLLFFAALAGLALSAGYAPSLLISICKVFLVLATAGMAGIVVLGAFDSGENKSDSPARSNGSIRLILSLALSLGILSVATLGLGFVQGYGAGGYLAMLAAMAMVWIGALYFKMAAIKRRANMEQVDADRDLAQTPGSDPSSDVGREPWRLPDIILACLLVSAGMIILPAAMAPSVNYDVLEYHLGGPRELFTAGRYAPSPHNVYTWMPSGAQMLFLGGVIADGGALGGTPRVMIAFFYLGLLWLTAALGRTMGLPRWARLAGAVLIAAHPMALKLTMNALADLPVAWFVGAALLAALAIPRGGARMAVLAGLIMGFAVWFKLTVLKIFVPPFVLFILLPMLWSAAPAGRKVKQSAIGLGVFVVALSLPLLPHLIKNAVMLGNPFYPALSGLFPTPGLWTPAQTEFWNAAHGKMAILSAGHWRNFVSARNVLSLHALIFLPAAALLLWRSGLAWRLIGFVLLSYFLWADTRQAPDRFLAPLLPALGLLAAMALHRIEELATALFKPAAEPSAAAALPLPALALRLAAALAIAFAAAPGLYRTGLFFHLYHYYSVTTERITPKEFLLIHLNPGFVEMVEETNAATAGAAERGERLLMLYEARAALFTAPLLYNTAHDQAPLLRYARQSADAREMAARMRADGIRWALLNEREMTRLIQFFAPEGALRERGVARPDFLNTPGLAERHLDLYEPYWLAPDWPELEPKVRAFHDLIRAHAVARRPIAPGWNWHVILAELPDAPEAIKP